MQIESEGPLYVTFTTFGKPFEFLINQNPLVTADMQRSRVNKTNAGTGT